MIILYTFNHTRSRSQSFIRTYKSIHATTKTIVYSLTQSEYTFIPYSCFSSIRITQRTTQSQCYHIAMLSACALNTHHSLTHIHSLAHTHGDHTHSPTIKERSLRAVSSFFRDSLKIEQHLDPVWTESKSVIDCTQVIFVRSDIFVKFFSW